MIEGLLTLRSIYFKLKEGRKAKMSVFMTPIAIHKICKINEWLINRCMAGVKTVRERL